ncbi:SWIM zinc finger family protein [Falsiroseomonas sp. HC035]|uniref:SWIM zinc finger family protein n=1 Tax=Falsiroseomonas sp. HC035 TaxID=3390999 RepID=UPI003D312C8F
MSRSLMSWAPYVTVAERRRQAESLTARLRKQGRQLAPVILAGRSIATTFWGKAWGSNLEAYRDYENRLPRGRSYVRNGSVIDLQITPGEVRALVNGSDLYETKVTICPLEQSAWRRLCVDCAGRIDSLVELLQGRFSKPVMERLCRQDAGLFPSPAEIRFTCSCPDHASMCKHVAAVLYAVGARLDVQPDLLFRLRAVDGAELIAGAAADMPLAAAAPTAGRVLQDGDLAALFAIDIVQPPEPGTDSAVPAAKSAARQSRARSPAEGPARAANTTTAGKAKAAASARRVGAKTGKTRGSTAAKPARKAVSKSQAAPPASASPSSAKTLGVKPTPRAGFAAPAPKLPKAVETPPMASKAVVAKVEEKPEAAASVRRNLVRHRESWSWKARAAARKAKRS